MPHHSKAVCEHGRPWYADCLGCERFHYKQGQRIILTSHGNRDKFFREHPEAAARLTE